MKHPKSSLISAVLLVILTAWVLVDYVIRDLPGSEGSPFAVDDELVSKVKELTASSEDQVRKLQGIWWWLSENIKYDVDRSGNGRDGKPYRNAVETFHDRKGMCFDIAVLAIVMCRVIGVDAKAVLVRRDMFGERISHMAILAWADSRGILMDPVYGIVVPLERKEGWHREWKVLDDDEVRDLYKLGKAHPFIRSIWKYGVGSGYWYIAGLILAILAGVVVIRFEIIPCFTDRHENNQGMGVKG